MQDWLAHRARATPGREALVNAASGNSWAYATLDETVEEMAGRLTALGVDAGDHLAAVLGTGVEAVCLVHAAMRLGTTLVPLSPEFTPPELDERLERADVDTVVCNAGTEDTVQQAAESMDAAPTILTIDDAECSDATPLADAQPEPFAAPTWDREDVQLLLFTSGTTGQPKAVQLTMGNLLASAMASGFRLGIDPADRWLVPLSLHHMGGIAPVLRSALYGTTAIIRESFDPGGTVDDIQRFEASCISLVPTMLQRMLSARGTLPDSLRFVLVGGAPCPEELVERCRDFSVPICPTYGMTETASQIATARHSEAYETPGTVGRPLIWTNVTVVDESGTPLPPGETGELVVSGPTVTPGYYDDPAATGEAMGPHGLHTGDVGYRDDEGRLYVLNRLDDRILTGGENVDPGEIVDAIREHPAVVDAAVVGLPDRTWGEEVAALLVTEDEAFGVDALEPFLRDRLAGFKLPRTVGFTEELPRTVSGTVERETVRERLAEGETAAIERSGPSGRAATETETGRSVIAETVGERAEPGEEAATAGAESDEEVGDDEATDEPAGALESEPAPAGRLEPGDSEGEEAAAQTEPTETDDPARRIVDAGEARTSEREADETLEEHGDGGEELGPEAAGVPTEAGDEEEQKGAAALSADDSRESSEWSDDASEAGSGAAPGTVRGDAEAVGEGTDTVDGPEGGEEGERSEDDHDGHEVGDGDRDEHDDDHDGDEHDDDHDRDDQCGDGNRGDEGGDNDSESDDRGDG